MTSEINNFWVALMNNKEAARKYYLDFVLPAFDGSNRFAPSFEDWFKSLFLSQN